MTIRALASATLLAAAAAAPAADWIRVEPVIGGDVASGHVAYSSGGVAGSRLDTADLGLDSRKATPGIEIDVSPPLMPIGFNVGAYRFSTSGSEVLQQTATFGGKTYAAATTVDSELAMRDIYAEINFCPLRMGLGGISLGLAIHNLDAKVSLANAAAGSAELSKSVYYPALALRAYVSPLDFIQVEGAVQASGMQIGDNRASYVDAKLQAAYFPIHWIGIIAGYRYINYDLTLKRSGEKFTGTLTLSGPYLGAEARF